MNELYSSSSDWRISHEGNRPFIASDEGSGSDNLWENRRKKISFGCFTITGSIFGVILCIADVIGDIDAVVKLANTKYSSEDADQNYLTNISINDAQTYFYLQLLFLVIPGLIISLSSIATYRREERAELTYWKSIKDPKSWWTVTRVAFHLLMAAPAARTIDLVILGRKCESLKSREDDKTKFGANFEKLQSRDRILTSLQHQENSFESGPQLLFKMHFLSLYLLSGKKLWSYGFWNLFFIFVGITSCSWKALRNRKTNNLSNDNEKKMSLITHVPLFCLAHWLSVFSRFALLGMFSATSSLYFTFFCPIHMLVICCMLSVYKTKDDKSPLKPANNWGSCWNKMLDVFHWVDVLFSTLLSFHDFDEQKDNTLRIILYYVIPFLENFFLVILMVPSISNALFMRLFIGVAMVLSSFSFVVCERFQLQLGIISNGNEQEQNENYSRSHKRNKMDTDVIGLVDCYPNVRTRERARGLALILNFMEFDDEKINLTIMLEKNFQPAISDLKFLLKELDYEVRIHTNLSRDETLFELDKFTHDDLHASADSTVVVVISQGDIGSPEEGSRIYTQDKNFISSEDVLQRFNNVNCPHLKGKPKIFIFQFDRGEKYDEGIRNPFGTPFEKIDRPINEPKMVIKKRRHGGISEIPDKKTTMASTTMEVERTNEDMLITYATLPGFASFGGVGTGLWFLNDVCSTFTEHAHECNVEDLFKIVDKRMKLRSAGEFGMQTLEIVNRGFNRKFYFNPELEPLSKFNA